MARVDSGIADLSDIRGKKVAFVDPSSASGYLYPAAHLVGLGYDIDKDIDSVFAGGHDKSLQAVLNGDVDVAAALWTCAPLFGRFPTAKEKWRISCAEIPIFDGAGRMDEELAERISATPGIARSGAAMLEMFNMHGFVGPPMQIDVVRHTAKP